MLTVAAGAARLDPNERLHFTPDRPLILFTDFPADVGGGANVIINGLLSDDDYKGIIRVSPCALSQPGARRDRQCITLLTGSYGRSGGRRRSWFRDTIWHAPALAQEVSRIAKERNAQALWVVLHHSGVPVAMHLARCSGLPVHVGVNDDPPNAPALRSRRAVLLVPWFAHVFARALRSAASVDTTSVPMAERYLAKYGVNSVVTHRGLSGPIPPNSTFGREANELSVGVLGNVYGYSQLRTLGRAVAAAAIRVGATPKIVVIGKGYGDRLRRDMAALGPWVEVTGHIREAEAVDRLRSCFALYLNYPFGWRDRVLRQTSFPVKLSTYLLSTRPVLFHGPPDTSINGPMRAAPEYIRHWPTENPADGAAMLSELWNDPYVDRSFSAAAEAVRAQYFDSATYRRNLIGALNRLARSPE
jgi:hypothetical protein